MVVSNHGGRQLDGVSATLRALPEIVKAVNGQAEVMMDGGVRRGSDIVKAICLGARAVLVGRAYAYGLAAAGEAGVSRAIGNPARRSGTNHEAFRMRCRLAISTNRMWMFLAIGPPRVGTRSRDLKCEI